ncbi:hypothetical protein FIU97_00220 [Roseivivax sp. THAF40]|uniref:DUF1330 domain-containing protein n=1 Tax=unclassified Roseivivax TaxID=2639302 RepID=UPI0012679A2B|nr:MULTISPECIES: DUF1330 domain-containing protein [unclassified Roseivivax]QFS81261.1 hypothetical protein FIV09_00305 [Roseivivax sp. THAF197b]QFT44990.1 hypothetical protein FIU97_00220 [Roseivivax sp. THAF40]
MTHYSILEVTPRAEDWIADYLPTANRLIAQHGGRYLARTTSHEQLEGPAREAALRILIEWPSAEAAQAFMDDPDYAPHLANRHAGSTSFHWLVAGKDDLA